MSDERHRHVKSVSRESDGMKIMLPEGLGFETFGDFRRWAHVHFCMKGSAMDYITYVPKTAECYLDTSLPGAYTVKVSECEFKSPGKVLLVHCEKTYEFTIDYYIQKTTPVKSRRSVKSTCKVCSIS